MVKLNNICTRFFIDWFWYHVYYKHTKKHKKDMQDTHDRVMKRRLEIIGK